MSSTLLLIASCLSGYLGFAYLALSQHKNLRAVMGGIRMESRRNRWLRFAGSVLLVVSLLLCIVRDGPSFGAVIWAIVISVAATAVAMILTFRARLLRGLVWWIGPDEGVK